MKVVSTEALTKLIQLVKSAFIKVDDVVEVTEIETETPSEITLATVATSGDYNDLSNKPTIPAAQVNSDWDATSGVAQILNKPTIPTVPTNISAFTNDSGYITSSALAPYALSADLATVATSGSYNDLLNKPDLSIKADVNLSNITSTGKNIANWSTNVSNCITEIPQDIKLKLNNGTLTLKAGSKVYVPNGVGVFDVVTVPSDVVFHSGTVGTDTFNLMLCCNLTGGYGVRARPNSFVSGTTAPTDTSQIWYDTTNNAVKKYEDGSWVRAYSLPIGIYVRTNGVATSIDQVFNGFGYIGSTVFALPGVKGLIPNGRNADGSLNNIEIVLNSVTVINNPDTDNKLQYLMLESNGYFTRGNWYYEQTQAPSWFVNNNNIWYNPETNRMYYYRTSTDQSYRNFIFTGLTFRGSSGSTKISEFNQAKLPFYALDYNDKSTISGWAMPSSKYIDLTLGASGATYTAPANGWIFLRFDTGSGTSFITIVNNGLIADQSIYEKAHPAVNKLFIVPKGEYKLYYANITPVIFRFVYAGGEA